MQGLLQLLNQVSEELNKDLDPDLMLQRVVNMAVKHFEASGGSVVLFDDDKHVSQYLLQQRGLSQDEAQQVVGHVMDDGFAGWMVEHGHGDIINNTQTDLRWLTYNNQPYAARSVMGVPMKRRNRTIGVITIHHAAKPYHFEPEDLKLLSAIAGQAAIALENAQLFRQKEKERATLSAIIDGSQDAVIVTEEDTQNVILLNPAAEHALQIKPGTWLGHPLHSVTPVKKLAELIVDGAPTDKGLDLPDGRNMLVSVISIPDVGKLTLLHDISTLKALDQMKSDFVTTFTHDLSAPLAAIKGYVNLVEIDGVLTERQAEDLNIMRTALSQMSTLIRDLIELTRLESLKDFFTCSISLEEMVDSAYHNYQHIADTKQVRLSLSRGAQHLVTYGNPTLISRAVENLVENAIKYTRPQGEVTLSLAKDGANAVVAVQDTGIGIPSDNVNMVFDKFFRAHTPAMDEIPGSGLGLSIVKAIVERHGGQVSVQSQENIGSTFTVSLPLVSNGF